MYHEIETLYEHDRKVLRIKPAMVLQNPAYGAIERFIVFDVLVDSKCWITQENTCDLLQKTRDFQ